MMALDICNSLNCRLVASNCGRWFSAAAAAEWELPPTSSSHSQHQSQSSSTKRIKVDLLSTQKPIELSFRQRFTVSPGSTTHSTGDLTGTWVWPTAMQMVSRLEADLQLQPSKNILELGSGCGLVGMTLAALGQSVVLTDHAGNVEWLRQNVELNRDVVGDRASVATLEWGNESDMMHVEQTFGEFDAIVGSDLIYDAQTHYDLLKTLRRFAKQKNASIYLGHPDRGSSESSFFQLAEQYFDTRISPMNTGTAESKFMYAVCRRYEQ